MYTKKDWGGADGMSPFLTLDDGKQVLQGFTTRFQGHKQCCDAPFMPLICFPPYM